MASQMGAKHVARRSGLGARARWVRWPAALAVAGVLTGYALAAVAITWHLWADPARLAVSGNPWDADLFAWYMRYGASAVAHGHLPALITTRLNAPQGISLMWNTSLLLPGIVFAPVTLLAGPQVSLNVMMTAGFAGSAASMFAVLRRWHFGVWPAAVAGAIYGFSPALVQSAVGHYNLQFAVLPPLIVSAGLRLFLVPAGPGRISRASVRQSTRAGLWLGLLAVAQLFIAEELLAASAFTCCLILLVATGVWLSGFASDRRRRAGPREAMTARSWAGEIIGRLTAPAAGVAVAGAVVAVIAGDALFTQFVGPLTQHGSPFLPDYYKNDLTVFTDPSSFVVLHSAASATAAAWLPGGAPEQLGYLGWPMIAVGVGIVIALWRDRRVLALAIPAIALEVLSLGAHPEVHGVTSQHVTLPWNLVEGLPIIGLALPDRLSFFADGLIAVLIGIMVQHASGRASGRSERGRRAGRDNGDWPEAADSGTVPGQNARGGSAGGRDTPKPRRRWRLWLAAAVSVAAIAPLVPAQLPAARVPALPAGWSAAFAALRLPAGARVLVVPVPNGGLTNAMRWQATSAVDISIIGGYFMGPAWNGQAYIGGAGFRPTASYLDTLWLRTPISKQSENAAMSPAPRPSAAQVRADLAFWRPAAVVAQASPNTALGRYLMTILGPPSIVRGSIMAWRSTSSARQAARARGVNTGAN